MSQQAATTVWSDPPSPTRGQPSKHTEFWEALKARPGEWAVFRRDFKGSYTGYKKAHPGYEFCVRTEDGVKICRARYVGEAA